ncbi:hypothetical protein [Cerasicoccus fimbriatus]|uniref:hypothetical protein n=1 Tax=Cerasicoccus fimbriatus TaxID=3014554 RepID=UPI0022B39ED2|nr:hypothetical protein [Cerasicoccus sp. TK19100]
MADHRKSQALIVGLISIFGAPLALYNMYLMNWMIFSDFGAEVYAWDSICNQLPGVISTVLLGIASVVCGIGLKNGYGWAGLTWLIVCLVFVALSLFELCLSAHWILAIKLSFFLYLSYYAVDRIRVYDRSKNAPI